MEAHHRHFLRESAYHMYSVGRRVTGDRQDRQAGPKICWEKKKKEERKGLDVLKENERTNSNQQNQMLPPKNQGQSDK